MFGSDLVKHAKEFLRYVRSHRYERSPEGIYFSQANALFRGTYSHAVNGLDWQHDHNIIPDEGLVYLLEAAVTNTVNDVTAWYLALYSTAYTPIATLTAATFTATAGEIISGSEGYSEGTRVLWVPDAVDVPNTEVTNTTTPADFTIVTATSLVVNGAGLLEASAKGATTGTLISAGKFASTRNLADTDVFSLRYKVDADAV